MTKPGEGDAVKDLLWVIGFVLVLAGIWIYTGGPASFKFTGTEPDKYVTPPKVVPPKVSGSAESDDDRKVTVKHSTPKPTATRTSAKTTPNPNDSQYVGQVKIRLGRSYRSTGIANNEYVVLTTSTRNKEPINITGWKIDNGYSERYTDISGKTVAGRSTVVTIPSGTLLLTGKSKSVLGPIFLWPGDSANVITGSVVTKSPYKIDASFKVNKCSGYLSEYPGYKFVPTLVRSCPAAKLELDRSTLSDDCDRFVGRYGSLCRTPLVERDSETGQTLVDGDKISSSCRGIVVSTFNYNSCLERHKFDEDFLEKKWFIYLNHSGLYADDRATITLYDSLGKFVSSDSY